MDIKSILLSIIVLSSSVSFADTVTLDFEDIVPDTELGGVNAVQTYLWSGYDIALDDRGSFWTETSFYVENGIYPDSGSDWLAAKNIGIQSSTSSTFDVVSADIAEWPFFNGSNTLNYKIIKDNDLFYGTIDLDELFGFDEITFSDDFKNIDYVKFYTDAAAFGYDNIVLSSAATVVPLPSSFLLFASSLGFLSFKLKRKTHK